LQKSKPFQFKQFRVDQHPDVFSVGTDAVLLGAWTTIKQNQHVLDVGTGTGLIALMAAQKGAIVTGIDTNSTAINIASQNMANSPWPEKCKAFNTSIEDLKEFAVDHILSNPPYFLGLASKVQGRLAEARHSDSNLPVRWSCMFYNRLRNNGTVSLVLPVSGFSIWSDALSESGFFLSAKTTVATFSHEKAIRVLSTWSKNEVPSEFVSDDFQWLYDENYSIRSAWYQLLCSDFYL
jgi:tRNA1Val (adenine37-N6)-methyltransferase